MPLIQSGSKTAFDKNVATLMHDVGNSPHVQSRAQALAVAHATQRRNRADGGALGVVPQMAAGGFNVAREPGLRPPMYERSEDRQLHVGPILSAVPGRTDHHMAKVPSGSYVIPADIVSGRGQGNTIAGAAILQRMFKMGPYGTGLPSMGRGRGLPRPPRAAGVMRADGGVREDDHVGQPVPVDLAGGEVVVPPENLMHVVHPDLDEAHRIMDAWVLHERGNLRKTLAKLPGPAKD